MLAAFDALERPAADGADALAEHEFTPEFSSSARSPARPSTATSSRPGAPGPGAWEEIDFKPPLAARLDKDWSYLGVDGMSERYDVVVVGSGAGGGVIAGELADAGRNVLLLEVGPHKTAADFMRWEARANHELWWPPAFAEPAGADESTAARCSGAAASAARPRSTPRSRCGRRRRTTRNGTRRPGWSETAASRSASPTCCPISNGSSAGWACACAPTGSSACKTVMPGFQALGAELEPVMSYTDCELHALRLLPAGLSRPTPASRR